MIFHCHYILYCHWYILLDIIDKIGQEYCQLLHIGRHLFLLLFSLISAHLYWLILTYAISANRATIFHHAELPLRDTRHLRRRHIVNIYHFEGILLLIWRVGDSQAYTLSCSALIVVIAFITLHIYWHEITTFIYWWDIDTYHTLLIHIIFHWLLLHIIVITTLFTNT